MTQLFAGKRKRLRRGWSCALRNAYGLTVRTDRKRTGHKTQLYSRNMYCLRAMLDSELSAQTVLGMLSTQS